MKNDLLLLLGIKSFYLLLDDFRDTYLAFPYTWRSRFWFNIET